MIGCLLLVLSSQDSNSKFDSWITIFRSGTYENKHLTYVVPKDGFLIGVGGADTTVIIKINGIDYFSPAGLTDSPPYGGGGQSGEFILPVRINDVLEIDAPYCTGIYLIPFK